MDWDIKAHVRFQTIQLEATSVGQINKSWGLSAPLLWSPLKQHFNDKVYWNGNACGGHCWEYMQWGPGHSPSPLPTPTLLNRRFIAGPRQRLSEPMPNSWSWLLLPEGACVFSWSNQKRTQLFSFNVRGGNGISSNIAEEVWGSYLVMT